VYDTTIGRWVSRDPIGFVAGDINLYRYVDNNPTNAIDPSGLAKEIKLPDNPSDNAIARAVEESIDELEKAGWKPVPSPKTGRIDPGAFGKEVERRVLEKLEGQPKIARRISPFMAKEFKVWYTDITCDNNGKILSIGKGSGGVQDTSKTVQVDAIKVRPGYEPKVGDQLDVNRIEELYELKGNRDGLADRTQQGKLKSLLLTAAQRRSNFPTGRMRDGRSGLHP
jgi:hypothetical protein